MSLKVRRLRPGRNQSRIDRIRRACRFDLCFWVNRGCDPTQERHHCCKAIECLTRGWGIYRIAGENVVGSMSSWGFGVSSAWRLDVDVK